jgi:YVTN family beta-propeller protein
MKKLALALTLACLLAPPSARAQNAYITNQNPNTVSVIDTATDTVIATIPVGVTPVGVAVSPDGSKVYVTNVSDTTVSVIDTATNTVSATVPVGLRPFGVAVSPDGSKVYIANEFADTVSVIDTVTNTVIGSPISVGPFPAGVAVTPDGSKVYVANNGADTVSVIETATNTVSATITLGLTPRCNQPRPCAMAVAVSPDGSKVYVTNELANTVSVIDTATDTVSATIPVGLGPIGVAVKPDGSKVYVANFLANTASVIDAGTNTMIAAIPVGTLPVAFGVFIQPPPRFAGVAGSKNCHGTSVSALATKFGGLDAAAAALRFSNVQALQDAIRAFCEG